MSAAVDDDLRRYLRECAEDDARTEEIERLAADYMSDAATLGDAATWLDHDTAAHAKARKLVGGLMLTAMQFAAGRSSVASVIRALSGIGGALSTDPALQAAVERMAERSVEYAERNPDHDGD